MFDTLFPSLLFTLAPPLPPPPPPTSWSMRQHFYFLLYPEFLFDLTPYINNPSLSDVILVSDDGQKCYAHRIVLCAQSEVLKTMLQSEMWAESKNKEVCNLTCHTPSPLLPLTQPQKIV